MLITLQELKDYLDITDNDSDDILTSSINQATSYIQNYTWRTLEARDYNEIRDWRGENMVVLKDYPVNSFTSYEHNTWTISNPVWTSYDLDKYWVNKDEWVLRSYFRMDRWIQNNKLVYNAWYTTMPEDLKRACITLSTFYYSWVWKTEQGVKKEFVDGAWIEYDWSGWTTYNELKNILDKYKIINI